MTGTSIPLETLVSFAHQLGDTSANEILPYFRGDLTISNKAAGTGFDPVTIADRAAEKVITERIQTTFPDHAILGEELGTKSGNGAYRWVIDPIDGTRAFITGLPTWGTLIGLEIDNKPVIGLMNQPYTGDRFWSDGVASYFRRTGGSAQRISTRQVDSLADAQIATTDPGLFSDGFEVKAFENIRRRTKSCRYGADCSAYVMLAAGLIDIVIESGLQPYDIVALIPIIENAGGIVTTWDGDEARHGGRILATGNATLHTQVKDLLSSHQPTTG